jgi:hypothetical protein
LDNKRLFAEMSFEKNPFRVDLQSVAFTPVGREPAGK